MKITFDAIWIKTTQSWDTFPPDEKFLSDTKIFSDNTWRKQERRSDETKNSSNNPMVSKMTPKIESKMTSKMAFEKLLRFLAHLAPGTTCSGPQIANHPPTLVSKRQLEVYIDILIYRCADRLVLISWLHPPLSSIPRETTWIYVWIWLM